MEGRNDGGNSLLICVYRSSVYCTTMPAYDRGDQVRGEQARGKNFFRRRRERAFEGQEQQPLCAWLAQHTDQIGGPLVRCLLRPSTAGGSRQP